MAILKLVWRSVLHFRSPNLPPDTARYVTHFYRQEFSFILQIVEINLYRKNLCSLLFHKLVISEESLSTLELWNNISLLLICNFSTRQHLYSSKAYRIKKAVCSRRTINKIPTFKIWAIDSDFRSRWVSALFCLSSGTQKHVGDTKG